MLTKMKIILRKKNLSQVAGYALSQLIVYHLAAVFGDEDDVILAHPFGMCQRIVLFCHII